jgi:hypothetical protein
MDVKIRYRSFVIGGLRVEGCENVSPYLPREADKRTKVRFKVSALTRHKQSPCAIARASLL